MRRAGAIPRLPPSPAFVGFANEMRPLEVRMHDRRLIVCARSGYFSRQSPPHRLRDVLKLLMFRTSSSDIQTDYSARWVR
jgi:hypothetical protein